MDVSFAARTDVGGYRDLNEDAVFAVSPVFAVADGMGGHAAGEIAAALAVHQFEGLAGRGDLRPEDIVRVVDGANAAIVAHEAQQPETVGMGTTISGVCLGTVAGSAHWIVFNVGDSRVYHYSDGLLRQITTDHSEVAELLAMHRISPLEARSHPMRHVITRSLGTDPAPVPDIWMLPAVAGERLLVCSDGLPLEITDEQISEILARLPLAQEAADALITAAVSAGGRDNVNVVVVDVLGSCQPDLIDGATAPRPRRLGVGE